MATCTVQDLLDLAAANGFTKLSHGDKLSLECQLLKNYIGSSDNAGDLLEASKDSGFTKPSYGCKLTIKLELLCNAAGSSLDAEVQDFITRAAITDVSQIGALNNLVTGLKADGLWDKFYALYPFVGGTGSAHSQNLASSSFTIAWHGTVTHGSNGITGDGSTGYGDTGLVPSAVWASNEDAHLYCYRISTTTANQMFIGVNDGTLAFISQSLGGNLAGNVFGSSTPNSLSGNSDGHILQDRTTGPESYLHNNSSKSAVSTKVATALNTIPLFVLGYNVSGSLSNPCPGTLGMVSMGLHLTDSEITAYFARVNTFQTALGRNV